MESKDPSQVLFDAFAEEGHENVSLDFALSEVDRITRWVGAHALEEALNVKLADQDIEEAQTAGDLVEVA